LMLSRLVASNPAKDTDHTLGNFLVRPDSACFPLTTVLLVL